MKEVEQRLFQLTLRYASITLMVDFMFLLLNNVYVLVLIGRFQVDADEVILRRTIGQRKDVYKINDKTVTKKEVLDHLETYLSFYVF